MIPAEFSYVRPTSIEEAAQAAGQPGAKVIAGGQSLRPLMKLRLARPSTIVDIGRIPGLSGTHYLPDGGVEMGALTTYAQVIAETQLDWTREALSNVGDVQVRNRHAVRNALLPATTVVALSLGFVVTGAITIETVFSIPGLGLLATEALTVPDYWVLQGTFLVASFAVILANLAANLV